MHIIKSTIILTLILAVSCNGGEMVPRSQYDDVVAEYEELREITAATQQEYIKQAAQVDSILVALSEISGKTSAIKMDVERGGERITQVQHIQASIDDIKERVESLEAIADDNIALKKIVGGLKSLVAEKEEEIKKLKKQLQEKDRKIKEQSETIVEQNSTISTQLETIQEQKNRLQAAVNKQAAMLYQAGEAFEALGDDAPEIKRKKDRVKVEDLTREMYENALRYYTQALDAGYKDAESKINIVTRKISYL